MSSRDERKVGDSPTPFLAVACTSEELNKFRIEYEKCHQKANDISINIPTPSCASRKEWFP